MTKYILIALALFFPLFSFAAIGPITGARSVCAGSTDTLSDTTAGGIWSSGATGVATVGSSNGVVTGVSAGTAVITYTSGGSYVTDTVTVMATVVPSVSISETSPFSGGSMLDTFIAVPVNGGYTPGYSWYINGLVIIGGNIDSFSFALCNNPGDVLMLCMLSSAACAPLSPVCIDTTCTSPPAETGTVTPNKNLEVYPNPVTDFLTISYHLKADAVIKITDVAGRIIEQNILDAGSEQTTIDMNKFPAGIYLYQVFQNKIPISTGKIVKQ